MPEIVAQRVGRLLCAGLHRWEKFPEIVTRLAGMAERFCTALDCVHTAFIADGTLDELPQPSQLGKIRVGGIDLNKPRTRTALQAVLALAAAPAGFTGRPDRQGWRHDRTAGLHRPPSRI
jgi:hypothetical protein